MARKPFWQTKTLEQMSPAEWESLCDGCGLCCLIRFEDEDTGEIIPTRVACKLFDGQLCRCSDYANRKAQVPDCIKLTPDNIEDLLWMPKSCAYRRLHEGRGLAALASAGHRRSGKRAPGRGQHPRPDDLRGQPWTIPRTRSTSRRRTCWPSEAANERSADVAEMPQSALARPGEQPN